MPEISIVIPAFNEDHRLAATLEAVTAYSLRRYGDFEVLVVDDGSSDGTADCARSFAHRNVRVLSLSSNTGKGAAVRHGVMHSCGEKVLITDADLSAPIEELERLEAHLGGAPVVIGSRSLESSRIDQQQPGYRRLMGACFRGLTRLAGLVDICDSQCGFKLLEGATARSLFAMMISDGFCFDVELIWLAQRRGYTVREIGVRWSDNSESKVRPFLDPLKMLIELAQIRFHHRSTATGEPLRVPPQADPTPSERPAL